MQPNSRIERLRLELAESIPCDPPTEELRRDLQQMQLNDLLFVCVEWAQRNIRPAHRVVYETDAFWDARALRHEAEIDRHRVRIMLGEDLGPYLSERVKRHGYTPARADSRQPRGLDWKRRDLTLNAFGVHHLHLHPEGSEELLFAIFGRDYAALLMLGDHKSFHNGEVEDAVTRWRAESGQFEIKGIIGLERSQTPQERTALARHGLGTIAEVNGKFVLSSTLSTAGTSMDGVRRADRIHTELERIDALLDGKVLTSVITGEHLIQLKGRRWSWHMQHSDLILREDITPKEFLVVPGPN